MMKKMRENEPEEKKGRIRMKESGKREKGERESK